MARVRHLVEKQGRFYWQPASALRAAGWRPERLPSDRAAALARAEQLNLEVDAWRAGELPASAPPALVKRAKGAAPGTVAALIADYRRSRWWTKLAPRTRHQYDWCLELIEAWAGDLAARAITPPAVQALYAAQLRRVEGAGRARRVVETPAKAAAVIRVLRLLLGVGERLGYLPAGSNPASKPGISLRRQREPVLWSGEAVVHMAAAADRLGWRSMATGILLNEWLGQREADLLALPPWTREAGTLLLRQGKTGRRVALPLGLVPHLVARLEAEAARPDAVRSLSRLLLHDRTGLAWNEHTWRHVFAEVREAAARGLPADAARGLPALPGMPGCAELRFAELRHTAVTRLYEAGVDEQGIAGISGHTPGSVRSILDRHYLIRTGKAAERAFRARLAAEGAE
jgi:hypothetical protein